MISQIRRFLSNEDGPTSVEYAVMLVLIIVGVFVAVSAISTNVSGTYSTVNSMIASGS
jgi:pilus assembly protein Flp/PilA